MQRIGEISSRIQAIQARVERPPAAGAFRALLDAQMASSRTRPEDAAAGETADTPVAMEMAAMNMQALNSRTGVTLGTMVQGSGRVGGVAPAGPVASFPTHFVPDGAVVSTGELSRYMTLNQVESRNGRLAAGELTAISGSWNGDGRLLPPAAEAWELMRAAAADDGIDLMAIDTYRTWESQDRAYRAHLAGDKEANVLPPGTSRHGVGLAVDITNGHIIDRTDPEWQWLQANGTSFGWYPISNETWHWEFRGV